MGHKRTPSRRTCLLGTCSISGLNCNARRMEDARDTAVSAPMASDPGVAVK